MYGIYKRNSLPPSAYSPVLDDVTTSPHILRAVYWVKIREKTTVISMIDYCMHVYIYIYKYTIYVYTNI